MVTAPTTGTPPPAPPPASGLGNAAMVCGVVTTVGAVLLWFVVQGMTRESLGRGIESAGDEGASVFGAIGCVAGLFAATDLAGLLLGTIALSRSGKANGPAVAGVALCALWFAVGSVVLLARA
ncbi:MAG: hypothetical protein WAT39_19685 [Planctomycetota bacterium]